MFLKSIDASSHVKNAKFLCEPIEEVIREVGEENVVQVVTENATNYVAAGKILTSNFLSSTSKKLGLVFHYILEIKSLLIHQKKLLFTN